jgi:hypothetical protein
MAVHVLAPFRSSLIKVRSESRLEGLWLPGAYPFARRAARLGIIHLVEATVDCGTRECSPMRRPGEMPAS